MGILGGRPGIATAVLLAVLTRGDITPVAAYALAALFCGFFWEMPNLYSMARWTYSIPDVGGAAHI